MSEVCRYKRWRLFNRKHGVVLPQIVRYVNLVDAYESEKGFQLSEHNQYNLTAIGCSFAPDDGETLGTVATFPYYLNNEERFRVPCGYVSVWDVHEDDECEHCGILFTYAVQPAPTFSHCGNTYCAVMNGTCGQLAVAGYQVEDGYKYFESTSLSFVGGNLYGKTLCARINEKFAVTITNMKMLNDLEICNFSVWRVKENLLLKHSGTKKIADIVGHSLLGHILCDASFSPDHVYFGVLVSNGTFILINVLTKTCQILRKLGPALNCHLKCFGFDPKFAHQVIATASADTVYLIDIAKDDFNAITIDVPSEEQKSGITHVTFSKDGQFFGVSCGNGNALIYSCMKRYVLIHRLCPATCQETSPDSFSLNNLCANRISFSSSSEEVCIAYNTGFVCVWQLPRKLVLKDICRLKVLCLCPLDLIESLEIPKRLKRFLKFEPIFLK